MCDTDPDPPAEPLNQTFRVLAIGPGLLLQRVAVLPLATKRRKPVVGPSCMAMIRKDVTAVGAVNKTGHSTLVEHEFGCNFFECWASKYIANWRD